MPPRHNHQATWPPSEEYKLPSPSKLFPVSTKRGTSKIKLALSVGTFICSSMSLFFLIKLNLNLSQAFTYVEQISQMMNNLCDIPMLSDACHS